MNTPEREAFEVVQRVQEFLDAQVAKLAETIPASLRARIDQVVRRLSEQQAEQTLATAMAAAETAKKNEYRLDVYIRFLRPIGRIAVIVFDDSRELRSLVMSAASMRQPRFLERAALVADVASTYPKVFVGHGMKADFIDQLRALLDQIRSAGDSHDHYMGRQVAATASLESAAKYARDIVRLLDALLTPALKNDPALLADWAASKRISTAETAPPPSGNSAQA